MIRCRFSLNEVMLVKPTQLALGQLPGLAVAVTLFFPPPAGLCVVPVAPPDRLFELAAFRPEDTL